MARSIVSYGSVLAQSERSRSASASLVTSSSAHELKQNSNELRELRAKLAQVLREGPIPAHGTPYRLII